MDMEYLFGKMEENMMESTIRIKKKAMAYFIGLMEDNIEAIGKMENSMETEFILIKIMFKRMESGFNI